MYNDAFVESEPPKIRDLQKNNFLPNFVQIFAVSTVGLNTPEFIY